MHVGLLGWFDGDARNCRPRETLLRGRRWLYDVGMRKNEESGKPLRPKIEAPKGLGEKAGLVQCPHCRRWYAPADGAARRGAVAIGAGHACPYCGMHDEDVHIA